MTRASFKSAPDWLEDRHEMPVDPGPEAPRNWSENYLAYVWSPDNHIGIYVHLCRTLEGIAIWNEQAVVALPDGRYLVSKGQSRGVIGDNELLVCGLAIHFDDAFRRVRFHFRGGGRLLTRDEYHGGPVHDGATVPFECELDFTAMSPPFDLGSGSLDQAWAVGHFEQHGRISGSLSFAGERYPIEGTGLRDHSWGARDYKDIGTTTWLHGQFPQSGRSLMAVLVTGVPPKPELRHGLVFQADSKEPVQVEGLPRARSLEDTQAPYELRLTHSDGRVSVVNAEVLNATRAALVGPSEIALGTFAAPVANHHYIDAFTRFEWDGEVGYGVTERTVDLT